MSRDTDANSPQRLALDLQRAYQDLKKERERSEVLLAELNRQHDELERIKGSARREFDSRLQAEEALNETQERLRFAVDATGLALWDCRDPFTDVFLSARWGEMLGDVALEGSWSTAELIARIHPDDTQRLTLGLRRLLAGDIRRISGEYRFKAREEWIWLETHAMVAEADAQGRATRLMGTHADITSRKQIEEKVAQARSMAEQASRAKSEFLANISHEIRTPLNAIMGLNQLLLGTSLSEEQQQWLRLMDDSSRVLLNLLNDVLDLSRIEAGKLHLERVSFPLAPLFENTFTTYMEQARLKAVGLTMSLSPALPQHMTGDPLRLRQVLTNLLSNAVKFTPSGGQVALSVHVRSGDRHVPQLVFKIVDTGIGIASAQHQAMFEAFTQADSSTARHHGGSGLGLAICSQLVKMMGGHILLQSTLGQGSTFEVHLPLEEVSVSSSEGVVSGPPISADELAIAYRQFKNLRVIVAEDNPVNELLMRETLGKVGCEIRVARNGMEAVSLWHDGGADLILMDIQMPGVNGLMATNQIREAERRTQRAPTPILAITANVMTADRETYAAIGMNGYVAKPIEFRALFHAMAQALQNRPASPATDAVDIPILDEEITGAPPIAKPLGASMDLVEMVSRLGSAIEGRDALAAQTELEQLKPALTQLKAERAMRICRGLDMARYAGEWGLCARALPLLQAEIATLLGPEPTKGEDGPS